MSEAILVPKPTEFVKRQQKFNWCARMARWHGGGMKRREINAKRQAAGRSVKGPHLGTYGHG